MYLEISSAHTVYDGITMILQLATKQEISVIKRTVY